MFANMKTGVRLFVGFAVVLGFLLALGLVASSSMTTLGGLTEKLHRHPFAVSTSVLQIKADVIAMHRSMKDVALSQSPADIDRHAAIVAEYERDAFKAFDLIEERFLGDKSRVLNLRRDFTNWKTVRDEVIALMKQGDREAAADITKGKGAGVVKSINDGIDYLSNFAMGKADEFMTNANKTQDTVSQTLLVLIAAAFLVGAFIAWFTATGITGPIKALEARMFGLKDGDLTSQVPGVERGDELGGMSRAVEVFRENAQRMQQLEADAANRQAIADQEKRRMMLEMADTFETEVGNVVAEVAGAARQLEENAQRLTGTADHTEAQAGNVAAASEQASANVQTVSSAAEELANSEAEIGTHVQRSSTIADSAAAKAKATGETVTDMVKAVSQIGEVIKLITDIAEQTNLLALNATIEAARAGDAGKGFAVVASEVKNLANQTARATDEIQHQISGVQAITNKAADAIDGISKTIMEVDEIANSIAAAVEEQTAATREIAANVEQAAVGTQGVSDNILGVTEAVRETSDAADQILSAARNLNRDSEVLRTAVGGFVAKIRA